MRILHERRAQLVAILTCMPCHPLYRSQAIDIVRCVGDASKREPVEMHWPLFEAHFQDDGAYFLHDGGRTVLVDVHHVELRPAGSSQTYSRPVVSADRGTSIRFAPEVVESLTLDPTGVSGIGFTSAVVRLGPRGFRRLRALRRALDEKPRRGSVPVDQRAVTLLASLVRAAQRGVDGGCSHRPTTISRRHQAVERAKEFLIVQCQHQPSLADVASVADYAPHHFARIFRRETGLSVHQYLTELRLRQAAARLDDGHDNLSSLALDLGFSSHSHFTTAFRARFGCAPSAYRMPPSRSCDV